MSKRKHFFIVGAQRSGTTYLYNILSQHPQIEMALPVRPEPKFFLYDQLYERGIKYYEEQYFKNEAEKELRGEKSTSYIESDQAAGRIKQAFPDAKILIILRDPIERAISNYWFSYNNGFETRTLTEALQAESKHERAYDSNKVSVSPYAYLARGRYMDYILRYERHFPSNQIKLLVFEQITRGSYGFDELYTYLKIDPAFQPCGVGSARNAGKKEAHTLPPRLLEYMLDYFSSSNEYLETHYGLNLSSWKSAA